MHIQKYTKNKKLLYERLNNFVESKNGKLLSSEYKTAKTKYDILCSNGHNFQMTADKIFGRGDWCPYCAGRYGNFQQEIENVAKHKNGKVLGTYINNTTKILCECQFGHQFMITPGNLKQGKWCPKCRTSHGEEFIEQFLLEHEIRYSKQYTFSDLKGKVKLLPFDFAIFNLKNELIGLVEYQGEQHFKPYRFLSKEDGEKQLARVQTTDKLKKEYCSLNNIRLFEIKSIEINDSSLNYLKKSIYQEMSKFINDLSPC